MEIFATEKSRKKKMDTGMIKTLQRFGIELSFAKILSQFQGPVGMLRQTDAKLVNRQMRAFIKKAENLGYSGKIIRANPAKAEWMEVLGINPRSRFKTLSVPTLIERYAPQDSIELVRESARVALTLVPK